LQRNSHFGGPTAGALGHPRADLGTLVAVRVVLAWSQSHWRRWFALPSRGTCSSCCLTGRCSGASNSQSHFGLFLAHFLASNPPSLQSASDFLFSSQSPLSRLALAHQARPLLYRIDCSSIITPSLSTPVNCSRLTCRRPACASFSIDLDQDNTCFRLHPSSSSAPNTEHRSIMKGCPRDSRLA
jgi:hypothetical protein